MEIVESELTSFYVTIRPLKKFLTLCIDQGANENGFSRDEGAQKR